jgi:hypothetical protein
MYQFDNIDITDSKRINGYVHYLIALQNCLDLLICDEHQSLVDEMKRVCNLIEVYLPKCEPRNLRAYISNYVALYPFANQKPLDFNVLDDLNLRILDAWMDGDDRISEIEAYNIIGYHRNEVASDFRSWY